MLMKKIDFCYIWKKKEVIVGFLNRSTPNKYLISFPN